MNYLKTFFITTILLSTTTIFNEPDDYFAYTSTQPLVEMPQATGPVAVAPAEIEEVAKPEALKEEKTDLQKWQDHLATIQWDDSNKMPKREWVNEAISLATQVLKNNKELAEELKNDFRSAVKTKITEEKGDLSSDAFVDLIIEFNKAIDDQLATVATEEKKETLPAQTPKPTVPEEIRQETTPSPFESFPTTTELTSGTTEGSMAQTSESASTPQEQAENQLLKQWDDLIANMREAKGNEYEIDTMLNNANKLAAQLLSAGKKTQQDMQKEFHSALEILGLKKKFPKSELAYREDGFNRALSPEEYQQSQQFEQEAYQQSLTAGQETIKQQEQKDTEIRAKEKKAEEEARKKNELATKAAFLKLEQEGKQQKAETFAQIQALEAKFAAETAARKAAEAQAQKRFATQITQPTAAAKKLAAEQKEAAEQGMVGKVIKKVTDVASNVKNWWYGSSATPVQAPTTSAELKEQEDNDIQELTNYLKTTQKNEGEQHIIINLWKVLQKFLRSAPQDLNQYSVEFNSSWISDIEQILAKLILTHHIITIDEACAKVKNALPLPIIEGPDYGAQVVQKIKMDLEHITWEEKKQKQQAEASNLRISQARQERKEQIMFAQQKIKDEEDRVEAEKKKQLMAADDYKKGKQEWKQLLAQVSQNKQATPQENHAHTAEAIKKSHSLLQLAHVIPSKNKHAESQKLKQTFTVALLDQQKDNENKLNIHHNMDNFNKEINRLLE